MKLLLGHNLYDELDGFLSDVVIVAQSVNDSINITDIIFLILFLFSSIEEVNKLNSVKLNHVPN